MFKLKQFSDEQHWEIIHTVLTNKTVSDLFINISVFSRNSWEIRGGGHRQSGKTSGGFGLHQ